MIPKNEDLPEGYFWSHERVLEAIAVKTLTLLPMSQEVSSIRATDDVLGLHYTLARVGPGYLRLDLRMIDTGLEFVYDLPTPD